VYSLIQASLIIDIETPRRTRFIAFSLPFCSKALHLVLINNLLLVRVKNIKIIIC